MVGFGNAQQRLHRPDSTGVPAFAAQLAGPHSQQIKRAVEGEGEGLRIAGQQFIERLDGGEELGRILGLQQFDQAAPQRGRVGRFQSTLETGQTDFGGGRVERRQMIVGAFFVGFFLGQGFVGGQADLGGGVPNSLDQQFSGPGARLAGLAGQLVHGPAAHIGMNRTHRPAQRGFRALAVPGPQRPHGLAPHLLRFIIQGVAQQRINTGRQCGWCSRTVLDQQLQGAGANFAGLGAQRDFRQINLARRTFRFGQFAQAVERFGANLRVVVVQQPLQAQAHTVIAGQMDDGVRHETRDEPARVRVGFPAELQQCAAGPVVAEPTQAQGALQGDVRLAAHQGREQWFQFRFGQGGAGRCVVVADALRFEFIQSFGNVAAAGAQVGRQRRTGRHPDPERGVTHLERIIVERQTEQLAAWRRGAQPLSSQPDQDQPADVSGTPFERTAQGCDARFGFQR